MVVQPTYHWKFNEREGSITRDEINGVEAKLVKCSLQLHGRIGNAIQLHGINSALYLGKAAGQLGTSDFTIAFGMVVLSRHDDNNLDIIGTRSSKGHGNWVSLLLINKHRLSFEVDENANGKNYFTVATGTIIDDHSWHHVALVREGRTLRIYVDGVLQAEDALPPGVGIANINNDADMKVGDWLRDTPTARYEDLRIYHDTALSAAEIRCLATPANRFLSPGQIELVAVDNAAVILSQYETDLTRYSTQFQTIRLGAATGATLYSGSNFEGISQRLYADVPEISSTKLNAFPKSVLIWPTADTPFTGKWIISAGNRQYLNQNKDMLEISSQDLSGVFFSFHYNPYTQQTVLIPANNVEIPLLKVGNDKPSILIVDDTEIEKNAFSIMHPYGDKWLTLLNDTLSWTKDRPQRTLFYGVMKFADSEAQVGELAEGEVALYQNGSYHGKTWVLSDYEPGVVGNFMTFKDFAGLDNTISSIQLGPNTGVTLFANEEQQVDVGEEETQKQDYVDNVPDMGAQDSQIGEDNVSSLKIFRFVPAETIFTSVTSKLSQDYRLVGDELEEFSAYRTILRLPPEVTEVAVSATDLTTIEVEGTLHEIAEDQSVVLRPNLMQQIMITSEADGLSTPGLKFRTNDMIENQFVVIFPDEEVHQQIAELEDGALWNATDVQGERIIDNNHSEAEIASVQSTIQRTMATLANIPDPCAPVAVNNLTVANGLSQVVSSQQPVSVATIDNPWTLNFQPRPIMSAILDGDPGSTALPDNIWEEPLEQASFEQLFAQAEIAAEPNTSSFDGSLGIISANSVFMSIGNAVKDAVKISIGASQIDGLLNAFIDLGDRVVRFVLNTAKKVATFVEEVVKRVVKSFKKFIGFLQFIFDWDDIRETKEYLVDSLNAAFDYVEELVEAAKQPVTDFFDGLEETVGKGLDNLVTRLGGDPTDSDRGFEIPEALEWLLNKFLGGNPQPLDFVPEDVQPDFIQGLTEEDFFSSLSGAFDETKVNTMIELFEGFVESIISLVTNPRSPGLVVVSLVEALKDLVFDILETLEDLALGFLDFVVNAIQRLQDLLNFEFRIPFITQLFELIHLDKLSPMNLGCLFIAIPATVISKLRTGKKPFDGVAPLSFSITDSPEEEEDPSDQFALLLTDSSEEDPFAKQSFAWGVVAIGTDFVGGVIDAILDFVPEGSDKISSTVATPLEYISLINSGIGWLASFPSAPEGDDPEKLPAVPGGFPYKLRKDRPLTPVTDETRLFFRERMMWGWRTAVLALDIVFFVGQDKIVAKMGFDTPPGKQRLKRSVPALIIISTALSVIDLAFTIPYLEELDDDDDDENDAGTFAVEILGLLPGLCPWLRLIPDPTGGFIFSGALSLLDIAAASASIGVGSTDL